MRMLVCAWTIVLLAVLPTPSLASDDKAASIRATEQYQRAYGEFYPRLRNLPADILVDELGEQLESAIVRGSHVAAADLTSKVASLKGGLFPALRQKLCQARTQGWPAELVERTGIESLQSQFSGYKVGPDDYARILSVVVRLLELTQDRLCRSEDFASLAK